MCEYCEDSQELVGNYVAGERTYASVAIVGNVMCFNEYMDAADAQDEIPDTFGGTQINFCPMCGTELR